MIRLVFVFEVVRFVEERWSVRVMSVTWVFSVRWSSAQTKFVAKSKDAWMDSAVDTCPHVSHPHLSYLPSDASSRD